MIVKIISVLYFVFAAGLFFGGQFLPGLVFGGAAFWAWHTGNWWPFLAAFALGWVMRLLGMDPGYRK